MSRDKQIEEMAKVIKSSLDGLGSGNFNFTGDEISTMFAEALYNAGYRKASDVARETAEAIKDEVRKKEIWVSEFDGCEYGDYVIATTDLEDIIRRNIFDTYEEAELKKKYTEGE